MPGRLKQLAFAVLSAVVLNAALFGIVSAQAADGQQAGPVVKVYDFPDTAIYQRGRNLYIDLGYRFEGNGHGTWVGYLKNGQHEVLSQGELGMMMARAGLDRLPPIPPPPIQQVFFYLMVGVLGLAVLVGGLFGLRFQKTKSKLLARKSAALMKPSLAGARAAARKTLAQAPPNPSAPTRRSNASTSASQPLRGLHAERKTQGDFGRRGW
ncbi:MAG: hypothetical protein RIC14_10505 [Filomicrobium sp.]